MKIIINGENKTFTGIRTISDLLQELGHQNQRLAVELNGDIVPKSEHATTAISDGDVLELVVAVGGG